MLYSLNISSNRGKSRSLTSLPRYSAVRVSVFSCVTLQFLCQIYVVCCVIMCCSLKRVLLLFGFLYFMSRACGQEENYLTCGRRKVQSVFLIHNGVDAKAGHWPWHAAIFHGNGRQEEYQCGGSILDQNTILTGMT